MKVIYEDNHLLVVYKEPGEIVQGDKTGDTPLSEHVKSYLKEKYNKPGNVFCGVVHRIDRPVAGLVIFARTSKALTRLNDMLRRGEIHKTYWALVERAMLDYRLVARGDRYSILEVNLLTGRKHQIRLQLSAMGNPIKGDLKYGARRSNPDGGISLLAKKIEFEHPVSRQMISVEADPLPEMQKLL